MPEHSQGRTRQSAIGRDLSQSLLALLRSLSQQPCHHADYLLQTLGKALQALLGQLDIDVPEGDPRFSHPGWQATMPQRILQLWYAWQQPLNAWLNGLEMAEHERAQLRWLLEQVASAVAPSNSLLNPEVLDAARQSRGHSLCRGAHNLWTDLASGRPFAQPNLDTRHLLGRDIACSPGQVIARHAEFELLCYQPLTDRVHNTPLLIVPPPINRFYLLDLTPDTSLIRHALQQGLQVYLISWRNPNPSHCNWGLGRYVSASQRALSECLQHSASPQATLTGVCSGGLIAALLCAWQQAAGRPSQLNALSLLVTPLDTRLQTDLMRLSGPATRQRLRQRVWRDGYLDARSSGALFGWMRPEQLVWIPAVTRYGLGRELKDCPVSTWGHDHTRLPAQLVEDLLDLFNRDPLGQPGSLQVNGEAIDLSAVTLPSWHLAARRDHIVPWQNTYPGTRLGGEKVFNLCHSGHIQGLLCPPGHPRAHFQHGQVTCASADAWLATAEAQQGSWWLAWTGWLKRYSGDLISAPTHADGGHGPAPGQYVQQQ